MKTKSLLTLAAACVTLTLAAGCGKTDADMQAQQAAEAAKAEAAKAVAEKAAAEKAAAEKLAVEKAAAEKAAAEKAAAEKAAAEKAAAEKAAAEKAAAEKAAAEKAAAEKAAVAGTSAVKTAVGQVSAVVAQEQTRIQGVIDNAKNLIGQKKYSEALKTLGDLANVKLTPEQQATVDNLTQAAQKLAARSATEKAAAGAAQSISDALGGKK